MWWDTKTLFFVDIKIIFVFIQHLLGTCASAHLVPLSGHTQRWCGHLNPTYWDKSCVNFLHSHVADRKWDIWRCKGANGYKRVQVGANLQEGDSTHSPFCPFTHLYLPLSPLMLRPLAPTCARIPCTCCHSCFYFWTHLCLSLHSRPSTVLHLCPLMHILDVPFYMLAHVPLYPVMLIPLYPLALVLSLLCKNVRGTIIKKVTYKIISGFLHPFKFMQLKLVFCLHIGCLYLHLHTCAGILAVWRIPTVQID